VLCCWYFSDISDNQFLEETQSAYWRLTGKVWHTLYTSLFIVVDPLKLIRRSKFDCTGYFPDDSVLSQQDINSLSDISPVSTHAEVSSGRLIEPIFPIFFTVVMHFQRQAVAALRCGKAVQMHCQFVAVHCQLHCLYFRIRNKNYAIARIGLTAY